MTRCPHPLLRYPLAFLFVVAAWFLLVPALDMPVQELQGNVLLSLRATAALTALAACYYLCYLPRLYVNRTDMYAILFLGWVTAGRFLWPGLASAVRYDELLQAAMLYAALRIIFTAERRTMTLLLMLLCVLGIYEAWVGIRQIYGFAQSNHGLFRITGTLFNPGPYAGFIAPVFVCAAACVARYRFAERALRTWGSLRRLRAGVLLWGVAPYLLGWVAALMTVVVLPASMSRAALVAAAVGCGALAFRVWNVRGTLPVRLPCASVARGGTFGAGCAAPRGHRGRGIPYQAPFGRGTPADVEDRHADHAPPSALRGRDRKFRRRVRRRTGTLLRLGRASESRNPGRRMPRGGIQRIPANRR